MQKERTLTVKGRSVMTNIIETKFGTLVNTKKVAAGSASSIKKSGAFYNFSIRITNDDIREYSFTDLARAEYMRRIMIGHLEEKIKKESKSIPKTTVA
jgi:hypothetical protein